MTKVFLEDIASQKHYQHHCEDSRRLCGLSSAKTSSRQIVFSTLTYHVRPRSCDLSDIINIVRVLS